MAKAVLFKNDPKEILEWNKRKILSHFLSMEEHLEELDKSQIPNSWCCVKHHLLILDHHLVEAIGHAERSGQDSSMFRRFRQKVSDLNAYPSPHITVKDVAKLRTEWRQIIHDPTLGAECPLCSSDVEGLKGALAEIEHSYRNHKDLNEIERKMADEMLHFLSVKYKVSKPKLVISPECHDPTKGVHHENQEDPHRDYIEVCQGGVNAHVITHEFHHYLHHLKGENQDEGQVERESLGELGAKDLNVNRYNSLSGGRKAMVWKATEGLAIFGGQLVNGGIVEYEPTIEATVGADMLTGIEVVGGVAAFGVGASGMIKRAEGVNLLLMTLGAGLTVHGAIRAAKRLTGGAALRSSAGRYIPSPTGIAGRASMIGARAGVGLSAPVPGTSLYPGIARLTAGYPGVVRVDGEKFINVKV